MKIKFVCEKHLLGSIPDPVRSVRAAPNYYKNIKPQIDLNPQNSTVKRCVPFLDAISAGFIIPLWADMHVFARKGEFEVNFPKHFQQPETLGFHSEDQMPSHPMSKMPYGNLLMKFINPWVIETDPGVSCLFTSPLNHMQKNFKILDGVVDTDTYYNNVNFPFVWTGGDGEFFFEKGTPLVQVIPFRREQQDIEISVVDGDKKQKVVSVLGTRMKNGYREEFWSGVKKSKENPEHTEDKEENIEPLILENPISDEPKSVQPNDAEALPEHTQVEDLAAGSEWKNKSTSGILEVVADDKGRGFGEGEF